MASHVFWIHGPGGTIEYSEASAVRACEPVHHERADQVSITEIMTTQIVCAYPDLALGTLLEVLLQERLGCVPVINEGRQPMGMVTKLDVVEHLAGPPRKLRPLVADVMRPRAITLASTATVADAAALMASEAIHHVMIVSERRLVGLVSTMDITRWLARARER